MNFTLTRAIIVAVILGTAQAAHIAACTENKDGTGPYAADATKACCENQAGNANINGYYDSDYGDCRTGITGGNKVNQGYITACCTDLGKGSTAQ
ncbi:hypothetical protein WALSEDRAFT_61026 [Wallemia mellicola CBS 633.66]|uniref:Uncharacterized protein n=1 Tax=Wallemia mellicola (strain ATCC MYA-4683 / CBS 633.66) TaxID=671144 RepID=I4Y8T0_WALMC|nr:hypothetical protein WALSEDRAFT_61026 [Wallemia mellicola CBS 633.66]EIM20372.1 hypothetical protein WALSEDRAFT_61026 [Wallemia mellicola CBS 633.66]|eukprot:XP_006959629.1 hypothetical protein WALSEDRAFT_61026 [Wallemia mellicola CBS 633.66]